MRKVNDERNSHLHAFQGFMRAVVAAAICWAVVLFLVGCEAMPGLYARGGVGYQIDAQTDYWQQTARDWQCSNPTARIELGYELNEYSGVALVHNSWLLCGSGLNADPESYANRVEVWAQWGGRDGR